MTPAAGETTFLLADIGGTHARFRLLRGGRLERLPTADVARHDTVKAAITAALAADGGPPPRAALLAVAAPVSGDRIRLTNAPWDIDAAALREAFGFADARLVNDFEAVAWSIPALGEGDVLHLGGGPGDPGAPCVVVGPGTGLGAAAYLPLGDGHVLAGEGGHMSLAAANPVEFAVIEHLRQRFGHVSVERAVSGPGLVNLYEAIASGSGAPTIRRSPDAVSREALAGTCADCVAALDMFCGLLGSFAGDMALALGARGGIYIGGGIAPRIPAKLAEGTFMARLLNKGRFREWLETVPVRLITHPEPAFLGLARMADRAFAAQARDG
ncbi:MAG: glucokinase [Alphaproteobacteria bacterium]